MLSKVPSLSTVSPFEITSPGPGATAAGVSSHVIDDALCSRVMDQMARAHGIGLRDDLMFSGAFEMLASGRDDGLREAMKAGSPTAGKNLSQRSPPSIAEILKPIEDRGLTFELSVCDELEFLEKSSFTPWSRGLDTLKWVRRVPVYREESGPGQKRSAWDLHQQLVIDRIKPRCEGLPANGCALVAGSNGWAVVFKDAQGQLNTLARKGICDKRADVPVLSKNSPGGRSAPASDALFRIIALPQPRWALAVAHPATEERAA